MATFLSNPTKDQMHIRLIGPSGEKDGMHLQPNARRIEVPAGYRVHPNTQTQYPRLVVQSTNAAVTNL